MKVSIFQGTNPHKLFVESCMHMNLQLKQEKKPSIWSLVWLSHIGILLQRKEHFHCRAVYRLHPATKLPAAETASSLSPMRNLFSVDADEVCLLFEGMLSCTAVSHFACCPLRAINQNCAELKWYLAHIYHQRSLVHHHSFLRATHIPYLDLCFPLILEVNKIKMQTDKRWYNWNHQ